MINKNLAIFHFASFNQSGFKISVTQKEPYIENGAVVDEFTYDFDDRHSGEVEKFNFIRTGLYLWLIFFSGFIYLLFPTQFDKDVKHM